MMKNGICLNDFFAVAAVLILAFAIFLAPILADQSADYVKITTDSGEQIFLLSKNSEYVVASNGYSVTVKVQDREVCVVQATCPDKVCVNSGKISHGGDVIICAPAIISVEMIGGKGDVDYAVG